MNKAILIGRLTRDVELRYTQGSASTAVANFTLAVDRRVKSETQDADFIKCTAFGKQAEFVDKYFKQGMKMILIGRIVTGSYTKDGQKIFTTTVVAEEIEFAENKSSGDTVRSSRPEPSEATGDGFMNIPEGIDEELPFN
jgi:single-strand DNA-binding protein